MQSERRLFLCSGGKPKYFPQPIGRYQSLFEYRLYGEGAFRA
ncbi:hypothetical protein NEICINOT_04416 [Neisseria cinerea ATCC 14685]|uniref:Uncharacterized protein n=1 Tax=Neisseria cinerea ATCC 14685 TaxID=546262 RepID=D0W424_NEICI|nr:hypothetical protein NEICINOT_04416 [Neisseria cinerea ATCC 14685]